MTEEQFLVTVERIQKAMAIEPFEPHVIDVVKLLSDWRTLTNENERLRADIATWEQIWDDETLLRERVKILADKHWSA